MQEPVPFVQLKLAANLEGLSTHEPTKPDKKASESSAKTKEPAAPTSEAGKAQ